MLAVDCTTGAGGHAAAVLEKVSPGGGFLLGLERDRQVAELALRALINAGFTRETQFEIVVGRFSQFDLALANRHYHGFDRMLVDLGVCSLHFDQPVRGFSLRHDGPLDMRLNPEESGSRTAAEIVNQAEEAELARIFRENGEERFASRVARGVVKARAVTPIETTGQLREVVARSIPRKAWPPKLDPATRVFQALRIEVNEELEELEKLLSKLPDWMNPGGRVGCISFHSLEDRRVKQAFRELCRGCICPPEQPICTCGRKPRFRLVTRRAVVASPEEIRMNPRSRSAKLRVLEKL